MEGARRKEIEQGRDINADKWEGGTSLKGGEDDVSDEVIETWIDGMDEHMNEHTGRQEDGRMNEEVNHRNEFQNDPSAKKWIF